LEPLSGYIRLAECLSSDDGSAFAEAWNFGPPEADCRSVSYIVTKLAASWGDDATWFISDKQQPHEAAFLKVDASKARARLGWNNRLRLNDALAWTAEWYRAKPDNNTAASLCNAQIDRYEDLGGLTN
jgi:CDP-glucose 4,6-dehydratase